MRFASKLVAPTERPRWPLTAWLTPTAMFRLLSLRRWRSWTIWIPLTASLITSWASGANLIQNGDFSQGLQNYTTTAVSPGSFSGFPKFGISTNRHVSRPRKSGIRI